MVVISVWVRNALIKNDQKINNNEIIFYNDIIKKVDFTHPYFNLETLKHQKDLNLLQGKKRTWYCGSYFGYGFHEDGLKSTINLIENFKI